MPSENQLEDKRTCYQNVRITEWTRNISLYTRAH